LRFLALFEAELALGDVRRHAQEHVDGLLDRLSALVLLEIALLENRDRVLRKIRIRISCLALSPSLLLSSPTFVQ
jgi:hypothetical protein